MNSVHQPAQNFFTRVRMPRASTVLLAVFMALLALGLAPQVLFAQAPNPSPTSPAFTSTPLRWEVEYADAQLGAVRGTASFSSARDAVLVELIHPLTQEPHTLRSTRVDVQGERVTIELVGRSPYAEQTSRRTTTGLPVVIADPEAAEPLVARVAGKQRAFAITSVTPVDADRVTLHLRVTAEGYLLGAWEQASDVATQRDGLGIGRVGRFSSTVDAEGGLVGTQTGDELWSPLYPSIEEVVVVTDQLGTDTGGGPKSMFAETERNADGTLRWEFKPGMRMLMVIGRNLPTTTGDTTAPVSDGEPNVSYRVHGVPGRMGPSVQHAADFSRGWDLLRQSVSQEAGSAGQERLRALRDMETVLLWVNLKPRAAPGSKTFTLGGAKGQWTLRYGDNAAVIGFARASSEGEWEFIENAFLPESVRVVVSARHDLPMDSVQVVFGMNGKVQRLAGSSFLPATRWRPPEEAPLQKGESPRPAFFVSPELVLYPAGGTPPAVGGGAIALPVKQGDKLLAMLADDGVVNANPRVATASVTTTPASLGPMWKDALARAAACAGRPVEDWSALTREQADEITNYTLFDGETLGKVLGIEVVDISLNPKAHTTGIDIGDHAAMILLRDEFIEMMKTQLAEFDALQGPTALSGFASMIEPHVNDERHAFSTIRVASPDGRPVSLGALFMESWVRQRFSLSPEQFWAWRAAALAEGLETLRASMRSTIEMAEETDPCDVPEMLELTGWSFQAVADRVRARLMKLDDSGGPGALRWVPDRVARGYVAGLSTLAAAVRAQEEYAELDTSVAVTVAALLAVPLAAAESAVLAGVALSADAVDVAVVLFNEVPEYVRRSDAVEFARGASVVLGADRLQAAIDREKTAAELAVSLGGAALGIGASTLEALPKIRQALRTREAAEIVRSASRVTEQAGSGGLDAFRRLPAEDQTAFALFVADARRSQSSAGDAAITESQRRAIDVAANLEREASALPTKPGATNAPEATAAPKPELATADDAASSTPGAPERVQPPPHIEPEGRGLAEAVGEPASAPSTPPAPRADPAATPGAGSAPPRPRDPADAAPPVPARPPSRTADPADAPPANVPSRVPDAPARVDAPARPNAPAPNDAPIRVDDYPVAPPRNPEAQLPQPSRQPNQVPSSASSPEPPAVSRSAPTVVDPRSAPTVRSESAPRVGVEDGIGTAPPLEGRPAFGGSPEPVRVDRLPSAAPSARAAPAPSPSPSSLPANPAVSPPSSRPAPPPPAVLEPDVGMPPAKGLWQPGPGVSPIELDGLAGRGRYATVYWIKSAPGEPRSVLKIYTQPHGSTTPPSSVVREIMKGSELLGDDIPQLKILRADPDAAKPYVIQQAATDATIFSGSPTRAQFGPEFQEAVVRLYKKIADKGLIWEDGHIGNIYFFKDRDGTLAAGLLDTDRIARFTDRSGSFGEMIQAIEQFPAMNGFLKNNIQSLAGSRFPDQIGEAPVFPGAEFFMEKMLEYNGRWIKFNGSAFEPVLIDPSIVAKHFKGFPEHVNFDFAKGAPSPDRPPFRVEGVEGAEAAKASPPAPVAPKAEASAAAEVVPPHPLPGRPASSPGAGAAPSNGERASSVPEPGKDFVSPSGSLALGDRLGKGKFSDVFGLRDAADRAVKFLLRGDSASAGVAWTAEKTAQRQKEVSDLLAGAGIRQTRVVSVQSDAQGVRMIVERLSENQKTFRLDAFKGGGRAKLVADGVWTPAHERAIAELFADLGRNGLVWEDAHLENLFFEVIDGRVVAGVLDHGRISKFDAMDEVVADWTVMMEFFPKKNRLHSILGRTAGSYRMGSAVEYMAKMLEHKGYIRYDQESGRFVAGLIDPDVIDRGALPLESWVIPEAGMPAPVAPRRSPRLAFRGGAKRRFVRDADQPCQHAVARRRVSLLARRIPDRFRERPGVVHPRGHRRPNGLAGNAYLCDHRGASSQTMKPA